MQASGNGSCCALPWTQDRPADSPAGREGGTQTAQPATCSSTQAVATCYCLECVAQHTQPCPYQPQLLPTACFCQVQLVALSRLTLLLCPAPANLQHLCVDIKHSDMPWHRPLLRLRLLLLLLGWLLRRLWLGRLRRHLLLLLLCCPYGSEHPESHIPCATCNVQVLHACKRAQGLHQTAGVAGRGGKGGVTDCVSYVAPTQLRQQ